MKWVLSSETVSFGERFVCVSDNNTCCLRAEFKWTGAILCSFLRIQAPYRTVHSWLWLVHIPSVLITFRFRLVLKYILHQRIFFYNINVDFAILINHSWWYICLFFRAEMIYPCRFASACRWRCMCQTRKSGFKEFSYDF